MTVAAELAIKFATALGIGLLIGAERERHKGDDDARSPAGIRTFAVASLLGTVSLELGNELLLAVVLLAVAALTVIGYLRTGDHDPGLTTEAALLLTVLLGALATRQPALASAVAVTVAIVLAARDPIHRFVRSVLSEQEVADALIFAAATLVIFPLVPDRYIGPFAAINPRIIWKIVILMMSISGAGYIAVRLLGTRFGLPLAGLASGFVSSAATISAMGSRAKDEPSLCRPAAAGAALSTVATFVLMAILLAATSRSTLMALAIPLAAGGVIALAYGFLLTLRSVRQDENNKSDRGHAFSLKSAIGFAAMIGGVQFAAAALNAWLGKAGVLIASAIAGFADAHSTSVSVASLVAANKLAAAEAILPILIAVSTNTVTKMAFAITSGTRTFALQVVPGLLLVVVGAWLGAARYLWP